MEGIHCFNSEKTCSYFYQNQNDIVGSNHSQRTVKIRFQRRSTEFQSLVSHSLNGDNPLRRLFPPLLSSKGWIGIPLIQRSWLNGYASPLTRERGWKKEKQTPVTAPLRNVRRVMPFWKTDSTFWFPSCYWMAYWFNIGFLNQGGNSFYGAACLGANPNSSYVTPICRTVFWFGMELPCLARLFRLKSRPKFYPED